MKHYLFKYILSLGAATVMASCSEDVILDSERNVPGGYSDKVCFVVSDVNATRGGLDTSRRSGVYLRSDDGRDSVYMALTVCDALPATRASYITAQDYGTLSMTCRKRAEGNSYSYYFADLNFTKGADGVWESYPNYWWLNENTHFSFYGYAPADAPGITFVKDEQTWRPKLDYTVPADVQAQSDIVCNTLTEEYIASANKVVPLAMSHALANIAFKAGAGMAAGIVNKVTVKNVAGRGTLDLTTKEWTLYPESNTDFTVDVGKPSTDSRPITTDADNTYLMLLPGSNSESTIVEVEFTKADGSKDTYSGPLAGTWEAGKQYMYSITVNPDFTITMDSDLQDAHYVICRARVNVDNMQPQQEWELAASASDGAKVTMLTALNSYQAAGFWTDEVWLQDISDVAPKKIDESARGTSTLTGTGSSDVYIFLPENVGMTDRTVTLTMKVKGDGNIVTRYDFTQLCPDWSAPLYGWEQLENDPMAEWGFEWDRTVTYQKDNYMFNGWVYYPLIKDLVTQYKAESFTEVNHNGLSAGFLTPEGFLGRTSIKIDYRMLNDLSAVVLTLSDGLGNTRKLYSFSGEATTGSLEQAIKDLANSGYGNYGVFSVIQESGNNNMTSAALNYIMRKNRFNLVRIRKRDESNVIVTTETAVLNTEEGIVWFLPAKDQLDQGPIQYPLAGEYWSSSPVENSSYIFTSSGTAGRSDNKKIRACRMRP